MKAQLLEKLESVDPSLREVFHLMLEEVTDQSKLITIGRADFEDLRNVVKALATSIGELTQAQTRTEARVDTLAVRMEELALAQTRADKRMEELAHAQQQTEIALGKLTDTAVDMRKQLGGLAMDVGYGIEDRLMPHLPAFCERMFGIRADVVDRRYIIYPDGRHDEANLYIEGEHAGQRVTLIGECKAQPGKRDFDRFAGLLGRVRETRDQDVLGIMVGYQYPPEVAEYARANYPSIQFFKTFEVERG